MELQEKKPLLFSNKDLKKLIWPLIIEQLLTVLVGMMDTIMVASVGEAGVSAVSLVDSIMILIIQIFAAIATVFAAGGIQHLPLCALSAVIGISRAAGTEVLIQRLAQ